MRELRLRLPIRVLLSLVTLTAAGLIVWLDSDRSAGWRGQAMARIDVARGRYRIFDYGLGAETGDEALTTLLQQRYGIVYRRVGACHVSEPVAAYVSAYDKISNAAIERKFGQGVVRSTVLDAVAFDRARRALKIR